MAVTISIQQANITSDIIKVLHKYSKWLKKKKKIKRTPKNNKKMISQWEYNISKRTIWG